VVLLLNTDDLFATAPTSAPVGRDRNYPDQAPSSAIEEVFNRYVLKSPPLDTSKEGGDRVGINLEAIQQIQAVVTQNDGRLILAITPLLREVGMPGSRDYEIKARQRLKDLAQKMNLSLIDFLPQFNQHDNIKEIYHDHIHFNVTGNQQIAQKLVAAIQPMQEQ
jgi:lysophospholipase L1-like esterase